MHDDAYIGGCSENNIKCVVPDDLGWKNLLDIFCHVTGFTSDFLSFIVVELIWFFHRAIQLYFLMLTAIYHQDNHQLFQFNTGVILCTRFDEHSFTHSVPEF